MISGPPPNTDPKLIRCDRVDVRRLLEAVVKAYDNRQSAAVRGGKLESAIDHARAVLGIPKPPPQRPGEVKR